ncbi:MAG: 6-phosphogluconolactonase [Candidatus Solibacter usitatus]|nr:6-phosphogluconolactonase [Candidatus Solibacter usitatus]
MDGLEVLILKDAAALGAEAAGLAGALIRRAVSEKGIARAIFSAANSQLEMVRGLTALPDIDWGGVEVFHADEYEGVGPDAPISFRRWVREEVVERVKPRHAYYLAGDAADIEQECARYGKLLAAAPIDVAFLGFGENGHIGFNDPHEADFNDPYAVRRVTLDYRCRFQQYREGHFTDPADVPRAGLTLSCPALVSAAEIICCVPGRQKAEAVRNALEGPVEESCPGSILRRHPRAHLLLDFDSASLLAKGVRL